MKLNYNPTSCNLIIPDETLCGIADKKLRKDLSGRDISGLDIDETLLTACLGLGSRRGNRDAMQKRQPLCFEGSIAYRIIK